MGPDSQQEAGWDLLGSQCGCWHNIVRGLVVARSLALHVAPVMFHHLLSKHKVDLCCVCLQLATRPLLPVQLAAAYAQPAAS